MVYIQNPLPEVYWFVEAAAIYERALVPWVTEIILSRICMEAIANAAEQPAMMQKQPMRGEMKFPLWKVEIDLQEELEKKRIFSSYSR